MNYDHSSPQDNGDGREEEFDDGAPVEEREAYTFKNGAVYKG